VGSMEMTEGWTSILVVQHHAQKATMDRQPAVVAVIDKTQLPEFIHEMTDSRPGRADHLRQAFLIDARKYRFGSTFLAKMRQQQQHHRSASYATAFLRGGTLRLTCFRLAFSFDIRSTTFVAL
jgi:hypothetical protein